MKQIFTLALMAGLAMPAMAQHRAAAPNPVTFSKTHHQVAAKGAASNLIVAPMSLFDSSCNTQLYTATGGGYLAGNNGYGDLEKMMRYSLSAYGGAMPAAVDTVIAFFGAKYVSGNANITAKVYAATTAGEPGTLLGTSMPVAVSDIDTSGLPTLFSFSSPVNITTDQFFVSISVQDLYAAGDTVGIYSSDECTAVDSTAAWDMFNDGSFMMVSSPDNWGINIEYYILASLTTTTHVPDVAAGSLHAQVFPNPASDVLKVTFDGKANTVAAITLKDVTGRSVRTQQITATAKNEVIIPISGLQAGIYFCEVNHNGIRDIAKVLVR